MQPRWWNQIQDLDTKVKFLYIIVKGTIAITGTGADAATRDAEERNK